MTDSDSRRFRARSGVLLAICLIVSACREDAEETLPAFDNAGVAPQAAEENWLEPSSPEQPATFLARLSGEDQAKLAPLLDLAARHYREGPRMIANRIGQVWQDLRVEAPDITVTALLEEFTRMPRGPEQSLGPRLQQYRVLRDQGLTHAEAIRSLSVISR